MKTFQEFNEDLKQLQVNLNTLEREAAPERKLAARRRAAYNTSRTAASSFQNKSLESIKRQRERQKKIRKKYLEQQQTNR